MTAKRGKKRALRSFAAKSRAPPFLRIVIAPSFQLQSKNFAMLHCLSVRHSGSHKEYVKKMTFKFSKDLVEIYKKLEGALRSFAAKSRAPPFLRIVIAPSFQLQSKNFAMLHCLSVRHSGSRKLTPGLRPGVRADRQGICQKNDLQVFERSRRDLQKT
eukprot:sb/3473023/